MSGLLARYSIVALARLVAIVLGIALVGLAASFYISRAGVVEAEHEWLAFQEKTARKLTIYNQMRVEIGFGGLIHNFKNYLLRKENFYRDEVYLRAKTIRQLIDEYRALNPDALELAALSEIEEIVNKMEGSMAVAHSLFETGISLEAIDTQTAFDEVPAVWALDTLANVALEERSAAEKRLVEALERSVNRTTWLGIAVIAAFAVSILLFLLAIRASVQRLGSTTRAINAIAAGKTETEVQYSDEKNEIGDLARGALAFKHALEEVQRVNEELNTTVNHLELTMEKAIQAEKLASLGQLVAGVAHEINTPLGVAITANSILMEESGKIAELVQQEKPKRESVLHSAQKIQEAAKLVKDNLDRSSRMVVSFRQIAADQRSESREKVDLSRFLMQVLDTVRSMAEERGVQLVAECPEHFHFTTYPGVLSQIITQLILNTFEHAFGPGESGKINIAFSQDGAGDLILHYADDGRGINDEVMEHIFDPFYTTSRGKGRTGLGMHVVFNQVHKVLQGNIECGRPPHGGVFFRVTIPPMAREGADE